jgi:trk system potassium uptake protein TrkA
MKIIILGAGQVGGTLAENLVGENNDITVVDTNGERLRSLQDKFDLRVVQGHGSHPRVLREAGADDADMLVAVTSSDETNMVACQVAYSLFNTPNRIARIRSPDYVRDADKLFQSDAVPIDHLIAPEQLVIDSIYRLIEYPGALQVVNFAEGKVSLAVVKPITAGRLSVMRCQQCVNICRTSIPALRRFSVMTDQSVRKVLRSLKRVMKSSLLRHHSIFAP